MSISKRDTILIAVLVNTGLLALLLMTAVRVEDEPVKESSIFEEVLTTDARSAITPSLVSEGDAVVSLQDIPREEIKIQERPLELNIDPNTFVESRPIVQAAPQYIEVSIKRGDALDKIARMHGVSVDEIKRMNNLNNDRLNVGRVLRIPVASNPVTDAKTTNYAENPKQVEIPEDATYYILRSGDNPWKLARKFNVNYEDILRLNNLDADKARNLRAGDKIRIK
jgi:LysM repeat protein